jgi:spermidine/putrescine transport system substrate-binding protein
MSEPGERHLPDDPTRRSGSGTTRRELLQRTGLLALGMPALAAFLDACKSSGSATASSPGGGAGGLKLASPQHPVTWPIANDNKPIAANLTPERGATLQLYNYADYIDPGAIKSFEKKYAKYDVKVSVSTFNDTDEAITKIRTGGVPFDIYFPSYDQISRLVTAKLIRPLQHSYIPGIDNVWATFSNPWYDQQWRYTVPYTVYTTGIAWRSDQVTQDIGALKDPYSALWDPQYKGKTAIIDDWHTAMAMVLMRNGITDVNTASAKDLKLVATQLQQLEKATSPHVTITMYNQLPSGQLGLCQMWSGDVVNAESYLSKSTPKSILHYWFPQDGKGEVDNDLMVVLSGGKNPVLAHLFIDHMLQPDVAVGNFRAIGYQPPQRSLDTAAFVKQGFVTPSASDAIVQEKWFDVGYRLLELSVTNDAAWHRVWQDFKAGV